MEAAAGEELLLRQDYLVSMSWACSSTGCSGAENNTHPLTILEARSLRPSSGQDPAPSEALWVDPSASPSIWWLFLGCPCFAVPCLRFLPLLSCGCLPCVCLCLLFFFKFDFSLFIFGGTGSLLLQRLFSSCGMQGLLSSCGAWASHCGGFSCYRALGPSDSAVVV